MQPDLKVLAFTDLPDWQKDDHLSAFKCFLRSAEKQIQNPRQNISPVISSNLLSEIREKAEKSDIQTSGEARTFFETWFKPHIIHEKHERGLLTAYYEPEFQASTHRSTEFNYPIYHCPDDLIELNEQNRPSTLPKEMMFGRQVGDEIVEYFDRNAINHGALEGRNLELFWLRDLVDALDLHIQGSGRLRLQNGKVTRVSYAAKSGHSYTAIGKVLVELGEMKLEQVTMQSTKHWLYNNPARQLEILAHNRSYIFFREAHIPDENQGPKGAAQVPLVAERSLAVDHQIYSFGLPFWVTTDGSFDEHGQPLRKLMIAQDTGSAITGFQRGDYFAGSGEKAGEFAGKIKHPARFYVLLPNLKQVR